jgi:hypothetical protein
MLTARLAAARRKTRNALPGLSLSKVQDVVVAALLWLPRFRVPRMWLPLLLHRPPLRQQ